MRLFLAVDIPEHVREVVSIWQQDLMSLCDDRVTWVEPSLFHVTVVFLGTVAEGAIQTWYNDLLELAAKSAPFQFSIRKFIAFPSGNHPRVVGVELHDIGDRARVFREECISVFKMHGLTVHETVWRPHITLGRVKTRHPKKLVPPRSLEPLSWNVSRVELKESVLSQTGPAYTTHATFSLAAHV